MSEERLAQLMRTINTYAGQAAMLQIVVCAVMRQLPSKAKLFGDFEEMAEDHVVRNLNSGMPEEFFQAVAVTRETWRGIIGSLKDE